MLLTLAVIVALAVFMPQTFSILVLCAIIGTYMLFMQKGKTMDTVKFKSVAVPIETWRDIMKLANQDTRTPGKVIQWLVKKEKAERNGKQI